MEKPKIKVFKERYDLSEGTRKHFGFKTIERQKKESMPSRSQRAKSFLFPKKVYGKSRIKGFAKGNKNQKIGKTKRLSLGMRTDGTRSAGELLFG